MSNPPVTLSATALGLPRIGPHPRPVVVAAPRTRVAAARVLG